MVASKTERLAEFIRRLREAPPVATFDEAYKLICDTINAVEDEMTTIPFDPSKWQTDGRMYPPQFDNVRNVSGRSDVVRFRTRFHNIFIATNGAIQILDVNEEVLLFSKNGANGEGI
jgi:hypothetical protein